MRVDCVCVYVACLVVGVALGQWMSKGSGSILFTNRGCSGGSTGAHLQGGSMPLAQSALAPRPGEPS